MKNISIFIFIIISQIIFVKFSNANSADQCTYCGKWKPLKSLGSKKQKDDLLIIEKNLISLPGCIPFNISIIEKEAKARNYGAPPSIKVKPIRVIMASNKKPECESRTAIPETPVLIEINMRPRGRVKGGWEILHAEVFDAKHLDALLRSGKTIKNNSKLIRSPHPPKIAKWWLLRANHNPCNEGTRKGESLCRSLLSP